MAQANYPRIHELLGWLDACNSSADLYEFQRHLFASIFEAETRRAACSQAAKRLERRMRVQAGAPDLPPGSDPMDVASWRLEILVCARVGRQLRCVGDGLAWRAFRYDRRFIMTLARNAAAGLIVNKEGLNYEWGRVTDLWQEHGHFALLSDLTTCVRIGDVIEFTEDGAVLHEVKKARRVPPAQRARIQAAVDAIMTGSDLPGAEPDSRLLVLSTKFRADMRPLQDAIRLARQRGAQGIGLAEGRMVYAASLMDMARLSPRDPEASIAAFAAGRQAALRRAGIAQATHHLSGNSGDSAGRSPVSAPLSIFPLNVSDRADLICDRVTFETVVSVDVLVELLGDRGLRVDVLYPLMDQRVPQDADVLQLWYRNRGMTVHAPAMNPLMFELLRPSTWCDAVVESLNLETAPKSPELVLRDEQDIWR